MTPEGLETTLDRAIIANLATLQNSRTGEAGIRRMVLQESMRTLIYRTSIDMTRQMLTEGKEIKKNSLA